MNKIKAFLFPLFVSLLVVPALADEARREIRFPDVGEYQAVACDLHMHTVFSDGQVWPPVRVAEAWRQGLDAIAITDHVEYKPHEENVSTEHNRSYDLAAGAAKVHGLLFPKGAEITRDTPPGHFNALFLKDIDPLDAKDFLEAVKQANDQRAFVFWNHHEWQGPERGRWLDVHQTMYENKWLHGMEVCNGGTYYPTAHRWCLEKKLTMVGNSDIHPPDLRKQSTANDHRTMTLVLVKERTLDGLKEALMDGRTIVWHQDLLIGRQEFLGPLFVGSVEVKKPNLRAGRTAWVEIHNRCSADIRLERTANMGPAKLYLPAMATTLVKINLRGKTGPVELPYRATNFLTAPETGLPIVLKIPGK